MGQKGGKLHHSTSESNATSSTHQEPEPLPTLSHPDDWSSSFLNNNEVIHLISSSLPSKDFRKNWKLLYSSKKHGKSFNRFCHHVTATGPTLIFIRDTGGAVFGGFADHMWRDKYPKFYGEGNGFVFSFRDQKIYKATGINDHYQWLNQNTKTLFNGVGMGGQENFFAWAIDDSFDTGTCRGEPNTTFGCPILSSTPDFDVDIVEAWEVKELGTLTYEQEKLISKKNKTKSVLEDDDNADKVITGFMGHEFSQEHMVEDVKKKDKENSK